MDYPLVTYIVITMNRADELVGCLASIYKQDYQNKEVVVVDNGSTDDTKTRVCEKFPDVKLVSLKENQGVAGGRNRGVETAQGGICIFIDDDARFKDTGATQRTVSYFRDDDRLAAIAYLIKNAFTGEEDSKSIPRADKKKIAGDYECSYFCGAGFALRREVFLEVGKFWEAFFYSMEELDFSYRLLSKNYRILRSGEIEISHRETPNSRPHGQWVYYNTRNRLWVSIRNLPWINVVSMPLIWWTKTLCCSLAGGLLRYWFRGVIDSLKGVPEVLKGRRALGKDVLNKLKSTSGKIWY